MTAETKSCPMCGTDAPIDTERCQCGYTFASRAGSSETVDWTPANASATVPGDGWQMTGWAFAVIGAIALVAAFFMGTTVETGGPYGGGSVVNLDLQFTKGLAIGGSLFAIGLGAFCLGVGAIVKAIGRQA